MPNYTPNINLEKPLDTENYDVNVFNANADKIDTEIKKVSDEISKINNKEISTNFTATSSIISLPSTAVKGKMEGSIKGNTLYQAIVGGENQPTGTTKSFIALNGVKYFLLPSKTIITGTGISANVTNSTGANANIMAVQLTTPYENWTVDQINAVPMGYWEGLGNSRPSRAKSVGKNLLDKSKFIKDKIVVFNSDDLVANSYGFQASDFVKLESNATYFLSNNESPNTALYNINKNFIRGLSGKNINFITTSNEKYVRATCKNIDVDTFQLVKGSTALPYEPYTETELFCPVELGSVPNGVSDEFTFDGKFVQRTATKTNRTGIVNYADMPTGGSYIAQLSDGTVQIGVKGDTLTTTASLIRYQLATPVEIQYPASNLIAEPSGTIYVDSAYADAMYYASGIQVIGRKFKGINKATLVNKELGTEKDITSQCTLNANKDGFTATGVQPTDLLWFSLELDEGGTLPSTNYSYPLNLAGAVSSNIESIKQLDSHVSSLEKRLEQAFDPDKKAVKITTFNPDGSIVDTWKIGAATIKTLTTTFPSATQVVETTVENGTTTVKTTTFNPDGSIKEEVI